MDDQNKLNLKDTSLANENKIENTSKIKKVFSIFIYMAKMGCFTFGGGWSIIAQMQKEFVEEKKWITEEQLIDFTSLARSFPGIMVINISVMFGYTVCGFWGALASAFGLSLPALISIGIITYFYSTLKNNIYAIKILNGVRSAVIPIILYAGAKLKKKALIDKFSYVLMIIAFILCAFTTLNKIFVVIFAIILGLILHKWRGKNASH